MILDVLVHYFIAYSSDQHIQAKTIVEKAMRDGLFYVSQLSMQELTHTMGKFSQPAPLVEEAMSILKGVGPINYDLTHFERAMQLATRTGFSSINDCLHTALLNRKTVRNSLRTIANSSTLSNH